MFLPSHAMRDVAGRQQFNRQHSGGSENLAPSLRRRIGLFSLLALCATTASPALAHPHVFVSVRTTVVLAGDGTIAELRHAWTFDEPFSAYATTGMDTNKDGKLDRAELQDLAKVNVESLGEHAFFSFLRKGKSASEFGAVKDYWLDHDGKALTLHFTLPVAKNPQPVRDALLEVYDPTYFVAFDFARDDPVRVEGGSLACTASIAPAKGGVTERLSKLSESFFQSLQPGATADWAVPVRFACQ